jgi:hypothetical protein
VFRQCCGEEMPRSKWSAASPRFIIRAKAWIRAKGWVEIGHDGSANATMPELVASAKPQCAIISVGSGNLFGLPPPLETLGRLRDAGPAPTGPISTETCFYVDRHSVTPSVAALQ